MVPPRLHGPHLNDDGTLRLDNTPWFVRGVASGDIIKVEPDSECLL
ncbi:DUF4265 domain-containing protein [Streptomyces sp. NPDC004267]